jgi:hypothetical protein
MAGEEPWPAKTGLETMSESLPDSVPRAHHDMGGVSPYMCKEIDTEPHELTEFDRHVDALRQLLSAKGLMSVDELRRGIEEIPEAEYHALTYYQRWIRSITATLLRKGVIEAGEIEAELAALRS